MEFESESRGPFKEVSSNTPKRNPTDYKPDIQKSAGKVKQNKFNELVTNAKALTGQGKIRQALKVYKEAYGINASEKLKVRIQKIEKYLTEVAEDTEEEEDGDDMVHVGKGFYLYKELYDKLYSHQREGVLWMWNLYRKKKGGILGDDMGLGKTIQVISVLSGLFDADKVHAVLIVLPVAVIVNWEREFEKWAPGIRVLSFHGGSKRERERNLQKIHRRGGVALTSYGMLVHNAQSLAEKEGQDFVWDYVILDEGHKIKNPSNKCSKGVHSIPAKNRLILTGTPIMNNLKEMWALFDYCHQGSLLGNLRTFTMEFESPINRASQKDATPGEQRLGLEIANTLTRLISPYFLRRSKQELSKLQQAQKKNGDEKGDVPSMPDLTRKNDFIIWVYLSEVQQRIYEEFSQSEEVKELLNSSKSPLVALTILKKICDHPRLLSRKQCKKLGLFVDHESDNDDPDTPAPEAPRDNQCAALHLENVSDELLTEEAGKLVFLMKLLDNLKAQGHRCLVFSQSRKMLDMIQRVLTNKGYRVARLDGSITKLHEREQIINNFSKNMEYSVFLLTTGVGGVGLTLTAADRVVIFDPSWNPATDAQAVDRAFRIGQDKNVVIYRLITCGSVEEKIYRRQIFKDSLMRLTTGDNKNPYKYFSRQELHELFLLDNPRVSTTQQQLAELHAAQRKTDTTLDEHIAFLYSLDMFGLSDHDLMFSKDAVIEEEEEQEQSNDYISGRVHKAQQLINLESEENDALVQQTGKYLTSQAHRDQAESQGGPIVKSRDREDEQLEQGMQHVHISQEYNGYNNPQHIESSDEEQERPSPSASESSEASFKSPVQSMQRREDEFVMAVDNTPSPQQNEAIAIDNTPSPQHRAGNGHENDVSRVLVSDSADDENDVEEFEKQTLGALMAPALSSAVEGNGEESVVVLDDSVAGNEQEVEEDETHVEKYCSTPQGKCMKEEKENTPSRTPRTPVRTPNRTPRRTPGIATIESASKSGASFLKTPQRISASSPASPTSMPAVAGTPVFSRTPSAKTPSAKTPSAKTPSAKTPSAMTPSAKIPSAKTPSANTPSANTPSAMTPSAKTPSANTPTNTPSRTPFSAAAGSRPSLGNWSGEFQVLSPMKTTPSLVDPARSIKKNKRRSVCLGGTGEQSNGRPKSPTLVQEQLMFSPHVTGTPLQRVTEQDDYADEQDSPLIAAKRARRNVIASSDEEEDVKEEEREEEEEEEEESRQAHDEEEEEEEMEEGEEEMEEDEEVSDDGDNDHVLGKSIRTFLMDDDDEEEDDEDDEVDEGEEEEVVTEEGEQEEELNQTEEMEDENDVDAEEASPQADVTREMAEVEEEGNDQEESEEEDEEESEEEESEEEESEEEEELSPEEIEKYNAYMGKSKALKSTGDFKKALKYALMGLEIYGSDEKAQIYVLKLKHKVTEQQSQ